jgi:hypothetical protein
VCVRGCRGSDRIVVGLQLPIVQSVPITTNVVIYNPAHGDVNSIQHYVIQFVNDLRMDNPETLTTLSTQDTRRRQATHKNRKLKR